MTRFPRLEEIINVDIMYNYLEVEAVFLHVLGPDQAEAVPVARLPHAAGVDPLEAAGVEPEDGVECEAMARLIKPASCAEGRT